jgi:UDP-glucose 4-epimerase
MANQKIVFTGGLRFIGSHTVVELKQSGYEVLVIKDLRISNFGT